MVALPDNAEIAAYRTAHRVPESVSRSQVVKQILAAEHREKVTQDGVRNFLDADLMAAMLKACQDAADTAGVRYDVFAAAVPVITRVILPHATINDTKD